MFSSKQRHHMFEQMTSHPLDVLVIGGGITGAGITLDAVTRGMRTALVDMQDFAAGTSSRSTKLVHGGLRYLKQFDIKVVSDIGKERDIVYENGPHLTTPEWMMLPIYKGGTFAPLTTNIGLWTYDFLAGVKRDERRSMLTRAEAIRKEPLIKKDGLQGAGYYVEYKTDDARLTLEVIKKAVEYGAEAVNYAKCTQLIYDDANKLTGVMIEDQITRSVYEIEAKKIINATGPWVDHLRELDGSKQGKTLHLAKGSHLIFSQEDFPLQQAIYFDAPDGRMVFAIPRNNHTYVGTTDTTFDGDLEHPIVTDEDINYLLHAIKQMLPTLSLTVEQIQSSYAGVRPLIAPEGKHPDEISRKDEMFVSESGLMSIAGGKLTGYRKMAEEVVDQIAKQFKTEDGILYDSSQTKNVPISGGEVGGSKQFNQFKQDQMEKGLSYGLKEHEIHTLIHRYGANIPIVFNYYEEFLQKAKEPRINPIVLAELKYAIEHELAYKPADFFIRRTGALYFNVDSVYTLQENVIRYMEGELQWTEDQTKDYTKELNMLINHATSFQNDH